MTPEMLKKVNEALAHLASNLTLAPEYIDQARISGPGFLSAYTPWGVASIEAAFHLRMECPSSWDSKALIRRDILENPHLHTSLKEQLLVRFEQTNWANWYDGFYADLIQNPNPDTPEDDLRQAIRDEPCLTEASRENLLYNLEIRA